MRESYTLYTMARSHAIKNENKTAITFYGRRLSFGEVFNKIDAFSRGLSSIGIKKGDVVSLCLPNTPSAVIAFYAINKLGAVVNLLHPYITATDLLRSLTEVGSKVLIAYDIFIAKNKDSFSEDLVLICSKNDEFMGLSAKMYYRLCKAPRRLGRQIYFSSLLKSKGEDIEPYIFKDDEPAVYLPSGGTTGKSKIVMHNCRVFNQLAAHAQLFLSKDISEYRSMYSVLPIFHGFGLCMNMHLCMLNGLNNVMCIKFDPKHMAKMIEREGTTILTGVPAMYIKLTKNKYFQRARLNNLRECFVGGDTVSQKTIDEFNGLLKRQGSEGALYVGYGLTETVTVCGVNTKKRFKSQSIGYPLPSVRFAIIKNDEFLPPNKVGEICVSTPVMMLGYYNSDHSPIRAINGEKWLFTGDYGYLDEEGYLFFKQRIKNTIKVNGIPIFPSEIEACLESIEGVCRLVAVGDKDENRGEVVRLVIEPHDGYDIEEIRERIIQKCEKELIVYARPRAIEFRESLPLNAIGKIDPSKL